MERIKEIPRNALNTGNAFVNMALYPDIRTYAKVSSAVERIRTSKRVPDLLLDPIIHSAEFVKEAVEGLIRYNSTDITHSFLLLAVASRETRLLQTGYLVRKGELYGDLHFFGAERDPELLNCTEFKRGVISTRRILHGLLELSSLCRQNSTCVKGITLFHGISDVINPVLVRNLGFTAERMSDRSINLASFFAKQIDSVRERVDGLESRKVDPNNVFEVWFTNEDLSIAKPKIEDLFNSIRKRN